ncbi:MAG TPA: hypothetical protein VFZ97_13725 [Acidimicrobiales bacterium]
MILPLGDEEKSIGFGFYLRSSRASRVGSDNMGERIHDDRSDFLPEPPAEIDVFVTTELPFEGEAAHPNEFIPSDQETRRRAIIDGQIIA